MNRVAAYFSDAAAILFFNMHAFARAASGSSVVITLWSVQLTVDAVRCRRSVQSPKTECTWVRVASDTEDAWCSRQPISTP